MPRQPRLDLPGVSQRVVQRGNDRQRRFFADIDRTRYLQDLRSCRSSSASPCMPMC